MPERGPSSAVLRFHTFEVDLRSGELYKTGRRIKLQAQPFRVLAMLLEHPSEVVTREELQAGLWPTGTFVDFEHSLNTAIKKLRQALCDVAKKPRFIETLPRRGYRFIGSVEEVAAPVLAKSATPSCVGQVARLRSESDLTFVMLPADEDTLKERDKLEAAKDDVGLSLLTASQRLLLVPTGTQVRILESRSGGLRCQVRILEGEHYGKSALVPYKQLAELP